MTERDKLIDELERTIVSLEQTVSDSNLELLNPMKSTLGNVSVVGIGEATHGTKEFFNFKHLILKFLITELNFRLIGIEANFSETSAINEYIVSGNGNPREALDNVYFWIWNTEEILALIEWLREYNQDRPTEEKVLFFGFDMQFTKSSARNIEEFLKNTAPGRYPTVEDELETLLDNKIGQSYGVPRDEIETVRTAAMKLDEFFRKHEEQLKLSSTERTWEFINRYRRIIDQAVAVATARAEGNADQVVRLRDSFMAENAIWFLNNSKRDKMVLWAHNGHVKKGNLKGADWQTTFSTMGDHLHERFDGRYYALGMEFGMGAFRAHTAAESKHDRKLQVFEMNSIEPDSVPSVFSALDAPLCFIDFDSTSGTVRDWGSEQNVMHNIGSVCPPDKESRYMSLTPIDEFDGLAFVAETEASVLIDTA